MLALQSSQISILSTNQLGALSTAKVSLLRTTQIAALNTDQIANLSTLALFALLTGAIAALESEDIAALGTSQIAALRSTQWNALSAVQLTALSTDALNVVTTNTLRALGTTQMAGLSSDCVAALATNSLLALSTTQIAAISTDAVASLATSNLHAMSTRQLAAMLTEQIVGLTTDQAASLSTSQVRAFSTDQIAALETVDFAVVGTASIRILTTNQTNALTSAQINALTSSQTAALTTIQEGILGLSTPIMLDLNGDGIHTLRQSSGVQFDLLATGQAVHTGWVGDGDGLLAWDRNQDGQINDGSELFGSSTQLADGSRAADGYQALGVLDANADGVISAADSGFSALSVWVDANANGTTEAGELHTLAELSITQISLATAQTAKDNNGNVIGLESQFTTLDGKSHAAADVWLAYALPSPSANPAALNAQVASLGQSISVYQATVTPPTSEPGALSAHGDAAGYGSSGLLAPAMLADAMRQYTSAHLLSAPASSASAVAMQVSSVAQLASDPLQGRTPPGWMPIASPKT